MININIQNQGKITVFQEKEIIFTMERRTPIPFLKTRGIIFEKGKKIIEVDLGFFKKEINFQDLPVTVTLDKQKFFKAIFLVQDKTIVVEKNPFVILNKKYFSKIYCDSKLVSEVSLRKIVDLNGINLELKFFSRDEFINYYSLICYLIYCVEFNLS